MIYGGNLQVEALGDREVLIKREFDAPRLLVFEAYSKPELVKRWLTGPPGWTLAVCEMDFRVGGLYRWVWRSADGAEMGMGGKYLEILRPERIVETEMFDQDWTGGEAVGTLVLTERAGKTTLTQTVLYSSPEARDNVLKTPMADGMAATYNMLAELLATMSSQNS